MFCQVSSHRYDINTENRKLWTYRNMQPVCTAELTEEFTCICQGQDNRPPGLLVPIHADLADAYGYRRPRSAVISGSSGWFMCPSMHPHDDVMTWKRFQHYWPFVRVIYPAAGGFPSQLASNAELVLPLRLAWTCCWANSQVCDLRRHDPRCKNHVRRRFGICRVLWFGTVI